MCFLRETQKTDRDRDKSESVWGQLTTQKARIQDIRQKKINENVNKVAVPKFNWP